MKENIVIIGAGSAMFTRGLVADLIQRGWDATLSLVDIDPDALSTAEKLTAKMLEARKSPIHLRASVDRREVLSDASVIITTIGVGGRRAWEQDVFIPRKYGIYYPVGDTVGPGGTSRAMRMIPPMIDIAKDVLDLAPVALFFNYANPMAPVCRAVRKASGANIIGLCHGVVHVARYLAGVLGVPVERLKYSAVGINHLTWFTRLRIDGMDAMPRLRGIAKEKNKAIAVNENVGIHSFHKTVSSAILNQDENLFSWQLMDLFGAFPAVLDRHVCEFFPQFFREGYYFGRRLGVDVFSFEDTIAFGDQIYEEMRQDALSKKPLDEAYFDRIGGEHEQVLDIIESIRMDEGKIYSANLPNQGQVNGLPPEAIIEMPAIADAGGLHPIFQDPLSPGLLGTLASRLQWVETIVEAAIEGSREKFIQALLIDGACDSLEKALMLGEELLSAQRNYLPALDR